MNTADTIAEHQAYNWGCWLVDDDAPRVPEVVEAGCADKQRLIQPKSAALES